MFLFCDQATNVTGWSYYSKPFILNAHGIIDLSKMPKQGVENQVEKRFELIQQLKELVVKYNIRLITTEGVYCHDNLDTHKKLAATQASIQDYCRNSNSNITCFSWENAGEWRSFLKIPTYQNGKKLKSDVLKELTKQFVLVHYDVPDNLKSDEYDAIGMGHAYFVMLEQKGLNKIE